MIVTVTPCLWYVCWNEVGDVLCQVCSSPFCTRPFSRMPILESLSVRHIFGGFVNGAFTPPAKGERMTNGHYVHKNNGFAPQTPENDENGGCHARKDPVCQRPCFCTPELAGLQRKRLSKPVVDTNSFTAEGQLSGRAHPPPPQRSIHF